MGQLENLEKKRYSISTNYSNPTDESTKQTLRLAFCVAWLGVSPDIRQTMTAHFQPLKSVLNLRTGVPSRDLKAADILPFMKTLDVLADDAVAQAVVLSPASINYGHIRLVIASSVMLTPDLIARHALHKGDVVVSSRGDFVAGLFDEDTAKFAHGAPILAGPLCHVLTTQAWSPVTPEFIVWLLGTEYAKQHMAAAARGSSVSLYSLETIGSLPVPILPLEQQKGIAEAAKAARALRESRIILAEAESDTNNSELCRIAGILS